MRFPYELWIALRYLKARRRELFISLITWISVGGVALGVTALVVVLSVMTGFEEDLRDKILGTNAHAVIYPTDGWLQDHETITRAVESLEGVAGATPFIAGQIMLIAAGRAQGAVLRGIDVRSAGKATDIARFLVQGRLTDLEGQVPGILVGREMARNLGLFIGDPVQVVSPAGGANPLGFVPRMRAFRISGIFASGMYEYDSTFVFVSLGAAQEFLVRRGAVTGVEVRVNDIYEARKIAREIDDTLGPEFSTRDWTEMNQNLFSALKLEKMAMFVILALIVLVAAFNIAATLIMVVLEKAQDIGILKSMGTTNRSIRRIFVLEGIVIGTLGTSVGLTGGWILCAALKRYKFIELPTDVYYIDTLPVVMKPELFVLIGVCALALCFLATLYPSWQAARLDPVQTLRYE